jgi:hypothetical protein
MSDIKRTMAAGLALTLYISGALVGAIGACMVLGMGVVAIFWGVDLVHEILAAAIISAIGLTIADSGRKKLRALPATKPLFTASTLINHAR